MKTYLKNLNNIPQWAFLLIYLGGIFLYSMLIGLQGFDMCDEGWVLSGYQQFFRCPSSNAYLFLYYNSQLIGGLWNLAFGSLGIIGFRLLAAITRTLIAFLIFELLKDFVNRWAILIGVILVILNEPYLLVFHHNLFTALLVILSVLCLFRGLCQESKWWILFAGVIVGMNIFSRIPNISMCSLSLVFIPYYLYSRNVQQTLTLLAMAIGGVFLGIAINIGIMTLLGHFNIFIDSISSGTSAATASDSTHSLSKIIGVYYSNYMTIAKKIGMITSYPIICYISLRLNKNLILNKCITIIGGVFYAYAIWKWSEGTYMLYALSYVILLTFVLHYFREQKLIYLITLALCVMFFLPFGSDYGVGNMGPNCIWISLPLSIGLLFNTFTNKTISNKIRSIVQKALFILVLTFSLSGLYHTSLQCYFDSGSRLKKTARPNVALATTFTTPTKCEQLEILITQLSQYVKAGDYLLAFQTIPMVNYLTETKPYLGNSWVWAYDSSNLKYQFSKATKNIKTLPVVVWNKSGIASWHTHANDWNSLTSSDQWNFNSEKIQCMRDFIRNNHYHIVWENELFQILLPERQNIRTNIEN